MRGTASALGGIKGIYIPSAKYRVPGMIPFKIFFVAPEAIDIVVTLRRLRATTIIISLSVNYFRKTPSCFTISTIFIT